MYFFLEQQQRGRESGRGLGKLGWREGRRERGASFCHWPTQPPKSWAGEAWGRWPKAGRGRTLGTCTPLSPEVLSLLWHRYANVFILNLLSVSLSFFASLKKWRRDLHNFSGVSPSRLPVRPLLPSTPSLRHPTLPPKKKSLPGLSLQRARVRAGKARERPRSWASSLFLRPSIKFL